MDKRPKLIRFLANTNIPLSALARLFVGGIFAYLAFNKLMDPIEFLKQTREYHVVPESPPLLLNLTAVVVPWIEIICAVALIVGVYVRGAAATILGMLLFFAPMLLIRAWTLYHDPAAGFAAFCDVKFDCGCGTGEVYICSKMVENTACKLAALLALLVGPDRWCLGTICARLRNGASAEPALRKT